MSQVRSIASIGNAMTTEKHKLSLYGKYPIIIELNPTMFRLLLSPDESDNFVELRSKIYSKKLS